MSAKILGRVWDLDLPHNKLLVLLALADHADHDGNNVFPSLGLVAWKTGYSEQQCRRVMSDLEKDGVLVAVQRRQGFKTIYRVDVERGTQKEPYTPSKMSPLPKSNPDPLHSGGGTPSMPSLKKSKNHPLEPSKGTTTQKRATSTKNPKGDAPKRSHPLFTIKYPSNVHSYTIKHIEAYQKEHTSEMGALVKAWAGGMFASVTEFGKGEGQMYIEVHQELTRLKVAPTDYPELATYAKTKNKWKSDKGDKVWVKCMLDYVTEYKPAPAATPSPSTVTDSKLAHDYEEMFGAKR